MMKKIITILITACLIVLSPLSVSILNAEDDTGIANNVMTEEQGQSQEEGIEYSEFTGEEPENTEYQVEPEEFSVEDEPVAEPIFSPGDTAYVDTHGADAIQIYTREGGNSDSLPDYAFYLEKVKIVDIFSSSNQALIQSAGQYYVISLENLRADMPVYTARTGLRQTIINNALKYNKGVTNTCYKRKDSNEYMGQFTPDKATYFDCTGFVRSMLETEIKKYVPTYDLPPSSKEFYASMNSGEYIFNKGYKNAFKITRVNENTMQAGDLIMFDKTNAGYATHMGIYLGYGDYIHCTNGWGSLNSTVGSYIRKAKYGGVVISRYENSRSQVVGIVRVIPDSTAAADITLTATANTKLRAAASDTSTVKITIEKGSALTLKYTDRRGLWAYVVYKGTTGFVSQKCISVSTAAPKSTSVMSVKGGKKRFTVKWKKVSGGISGYQIQYGRKSNFSDGKIVTISKKTTVSRTIKKLKARKKYYVRVRTFKGSGSSRTYSPWSKKRSVKTR